jgi:tetratricopeptide (TPR) repeat protein
MRWIYWVLGVGAVLSIAIVALVFELKNEVNFVADRSSAEIEKAKLSKPYVTQYLALLKSKHYKQAFANLKLATDIEQTGAHSFIYGGYAYHCLANPKQAAFYFDLALAENKKDQSLFLLNFFVRKPLDLSKEIAQFKTKGTPFITSICPEKLKQQMGKQR